jgi:hypothetical protein
MALRAIFTQGGAAVERRRLPWANMRRAFSAISGIIVKMALRDFDNQTPPFLILILNF